MGWKRGGYTTIRRFFASTLPWSILAWEFFRVHCFNSNHTYLLVGDETVVSKSGKQTYGIGRFFSSLDDKPIPGLSFFCLSLVDVESSTAWPLRLAQLLPSHKKQQTEAQNSSPQETEASSGRKRGRPKGSQNKDKAQVSLTTELRLIQSEIQALQSTIARFFPLRYVALDGHFGNNPATQMIRQCGLHIISKLRQDSQLFMPYQGSDPRRKYGERLNPLQMPASTLVDCATAGSILTQIYQLKALNRNFGCPLNVVVILKTNLKTHQQAYVILFSSDLELGYQQIVKYYTLRFQIEFVFRDAKQFFGLEDFMNRTEQGVTNAANLSFFMVVVAQKLLMQLKPHWPDVSILDLKAWFRGYRYTEEILKYLPEKLDPILSAPIFANIVNLGAIHPFPGSGTLEEIP